MRSGILRRSPYTAPRGAIDTPVRRHALPLLAGLLLALPAPSLAEDIRERLTEREDENRVEEPWTTELFGHPLSVSGEAELAIEAVDPIVRGEGPGGGERVLFGPEIEAEAFYTLGEPLSFFAQVRAGYEWDVLAETRSGVSAGFVELGEMWVYSENILGSGLSVELGHLDFEDDRTWWWDEELFAIRVDYEGPFDAELALAYPIARTRSDQHFIDPDAAGRLRLLGEATWEWAESNSLELFFLLERDRSGDRSLGRVRSEDREDESDARLLWVGPRAIGGFAAGEGILGYWLDAAIVVGEEDVVAFEPVGFGRSVIEDVRAQDVRGWGFDAGLTWFLPGTLEPRGTLGVAMGSGDSSPGRGRDRGFRQTGLHGNEIGFGGVQRFGTYGRLLDPELSNLAVLTVGAGVSLFESSSADLVYHHYRLLEPADELRDARIETAFDGRRRDVGHAIDLVLAIEEHDRFEMELSVSAFRAGPAWGRRSGDWGFGGFAAVRMAF